MRKVVVIPTYWSRAIGEPWREGDAVYDHPTPVDQEGTLGRTLVSMNILKDKDFILVLLLCPTAEEILDAAQEKVLSIIKEAKIDFPVFVISPTEVNKIKALALEAEITEDAINLMNLNGYANVRNMCIYAAYVFGGDVAILIDDDEIFEKEDFMSIATEYIGGRLYGKTIDGVAGYYLNKFNNYYDDVNMVPWMTYWDRFGSKALAFNKIIGSEPRIKPTPFAFGGAMVIHRNLFKMVPFDPRITRGEDIDYLLNAKMYGFHFFLDRELSIKHLPPRKSHPVWKRFREDIYRFLYEKRKIETQYEVPNMNLVTPQDFAPYPGNFLTDDLEDLIFKANVMLAMDYLSDNDIEAAKESMRNIFLSKYDAQPHDDVFTYLRYLQKSWRKLLKFTKKHMMQVRAVFDRCDTCKLGVSEDFKDHIKKATIEDVKGMLGKLDFFKTMDSKFMEFIAGIAQTTVYERDEYIARKGDRNDTLYIIWSGKVRISKFNNDSDEIILAKLQEGEYFGESNIISETMQVNIIAEEETILICFSEKEILDLINSYPRFGISFLTLFTQKLAEKLENSNKMFFEIINKNQGIDLFE